MPKLVSGDGNSAITLSKVIPCQAAPHAARELLLLTTPVSRTPAQSVAMLSGTDGLPPWLDINRFHVSRHSSFLSHCNGSKEESSMSD